MWSETDGDTATFDENNRNADWDYDADGRVISRNEEQEYPGEYEPLAFIFDAAGRNIGSHQTYTRPHPTQSGETWTVDTVRAKTLDGDGRVVKSAVTNTGAPGTDTEYFIRSSVTGNTIIELNAQGNKKNAFVYAAGQVIAQQFAVGTPWVAWQHENPIMGDALNTQSNSVEAARTTLDPLGINTGDEDPFFDTAGGGESGLSQSFIDKFTGSIIPWFGGPRCFIDRAITGCHFARSFAAGDGAEPYRPNQVSIYSAADRRYVGFAYYNASQAAAGISVFGLPAGWAPAGMTFYGNSRDHVWTFSSSFGSSDFYAAALADLNRNNYTTLANLFSGYVQDGVVRGNHFEEIAAAYETAQRKEWYAVGFSKDEYRQINEQVNSMYNNPECSKAFEAAGLRSVHSMMNSGHVVFVHKRLLGRMANNASWLGNETFRTSILAGFDEYPLAADVTLIGQQRNGNYYSGLSGRAFGGAIDTVPRVIVHSLIHAAGRPGSGADVTDVYTLPSIPPLTQDPIVVTRTRKPAHDLEYMGPAYERIMKACVR